MRISVNRLWRQDSSPMICRKQDVRYWRNSVINGDIQNSETMLNLNMMQWIRYCIICLSVLITISQVEARPGEIAPIAVIYPEVGKPYQDVIDSIIQGIRQQTGASLE